MEKGGCLCAQLRDLGYTTHHQLLSSRNVVPQDRLRLYIVGFLDATKHAEFTWPVRLLSKFEDAMPPPPCVRDILEEDVSQEFTINEHQWAKLQVRHTVPAACTFLAAYLPFCRL
jgi:DNA (cytosine-5)-methyltransferase 1